MSITINCSICGRPMTESGSRYFGKFYCQNCELLGLANYMKELDKLIKNEKEEN